MSPIHYQNIPEFDKDLKKLLKRFPTLEDDLITARKNAVELYHIHHIDNQSVFEIPHLTTKDIQIFKLKKFACKSLPGKGVKSGIRIIYAYCPQNLKVIFLEIYFKPDKENEDKKRILLFLKDL